ncbi:acetamidase/formamidase family protein [bacterium]|nr:acetamidase/formamidase family protein [bacterium]
MLVESFHHDFNRERPPVLSLPSGSTVTFRSWDVAWGMQNHRAEGGPRLKQPPSGDSPCLCGPVAIQGARAGRVLRIQIQSVEPGPWGWTLAGGNDFFNADLNRRLGLDQETFILRWDIQDGWATSHLGHRVRTAPFPGMLGMPRDLPGSQSAWQPARTGGNLDCRLLQAGSVLYLPIEVEGGLLSCGDGHALQADGECAGSAIECPMETTVTLEVVDMDVNQPLIQLGDDWVVLGLGQSLEEAQTLALKGMLDWMAPRMGLTRLQCMALASLHCHLHITQVVNGTVGVHARWRQNA